MTDQHPITPPPELVGEWLCDDGYPWDPSEQVTITITTNRLRNVATQSARWGADQELEACCADILQILAGIFEDKVEDWNHFVDLLRDGRRPPPQEKALDALLEERANFSSIANFELIKSVLERLLDD